jgi:hypothetical protein
MGARVTLTETELLDELRTAAAKGSATDAPTFDELRESTGFSLMMLRRTLKRLVSTGQMECVKVYRARVDGQHNPVPGYRLKGKR